MGGLLAPAGTGADPLIAEIIPIQSQEESLLKESLALEETSLNYLHKGIQSNMESKEELKHSPSQRSLNSKEWNQQEMEGQEARE